MLLWLQTNIGTIVVVLVLLLIVGLVIRKLVRDRQKGKTTCACGCENCAMRDMCHEKK